MKVLPDIQLTALERNAKKEKSDAIIKKCALIVAFLSVFFFFIKLLFL